MKTIIPALTLMLSAACLTGCDSNDGGDLAALQAQIEDGDDDGLVEALRAQTDDDDGEGAPALETDMDLVDDSRPSLAICSAWTPTRAQCERADNECLDPDITPDPCAILVKCLQCHVDWLGGA